MIQKPGKTNVFYKGIIILFFILQIVLPTRHYFFRGLVHWTEEGHRLSWHMMLRSKSGKVEFIIKNNRNEIIDIVDPRQDLSTEQAQALTSRPDMIWQFAQILKKRYSGKLKNEVKIFVNSRASLNGRPWQVFIDPNVDLGSVNWHHFKHANWILPMKNI